jgi:hypothetical protein
MKSKLVIRTDSRKEKEELHCILETSLVVCADFQVSLADEDFTTSLQYQRE